MKLLLEKEALYAERTRWRQRAAFHRENAARLLVAAVTAPVHLRETVMQVQSIHADMTQACIAMQERLDDLASTVVTAEKAYEDLRHELRMTEYPSE